ncbi:serine/threonine protein kinase [Persicimonas caeni]|uniref:non-specific serine/threonine protein kinase n=1 Tax=Persicimonas caeni TaxID=2292766 RepID=A0A4Y6PYS4_PERCE|nr:serine/threonine-protein kinase [Persicimonas caeni]QDG53413.1 serine/threonine protein kinase [Persicimonas caeni]QED34634.1 serine/threonine protein kinase [Persicimonas caeni]
MTDELTRQEWTRRQWEQFAKDPTARRNVGAPPHGEVPPQVRQRVMRMIRAEAESRQPGDFERPSAVVAPFLLHERYLVCGLLGFGGQARTWFALDQQSGQHVAVKELDLGRLQQWKSLQLFEREAEVLKRMDHPGVPHYVDSFKRQDGGDVAFFMAMEFIEGETLEEELRTHGSFDPAAAADVRDALFETLSYIHRFEPPIVHRDIKPSNLIRTPEGRIVLVDFGTVQASAARSMGGSTVVGTSGYTSIEQFMGKAVPASDLYAVGATLLHLLSNRPPTEFETAENRLQFDDVVRLPERWRQGLRALLEPAVERRPSTVEAARDAFATQPVEEPESEKAPESSKEKSSPLLKIVIALLAVTVVPLWYYGEQRQKGYVDVANIYETKPESAMTVLFIGNSHTYWRIPRYVAEMTKSAGEAPLWYELSASPGRDLSWHVDEDAESKIHNGQYDVVVLQPQSLEPAAQETTFGAALAKLENAAIQSDARSIVWIPWARAPETDIYNIYPEFGDYDRLTKALARGVRSWTSSSAVCPIGEVWADVREAHPDIRLHSPQNGNSATAAGSYLTGLVLFHCLHGASPTKVTWESGKISKATSSTLRRAAAKALAPVGDESPGQ